MNTTKRMQELCTKIKSLKVYLITDGERHYNFEIRDSESDEKIDHNFCWQPTPSYAIESAYAYLDKNFYKG